jgi:hypothetical protein
MTLINPRENQAGLIEALAIRDVVAFLILRLITSIPAADHFGLPAEKLVRAHSFDMCIAEEHVHTSIVAAAVKP